MFPTEPVISSGDVLLRHMIAEDFEALAKVAIDPAIWTYFVYSVKDAPSLRAYIDDVLKLHDANARFTFAIIEKSTDSVVGSSAFGSYVPHDKRIEIGWSWIAPRWQGTDFNRRAKFMMMQYAFEGLGLERVEFKTDVMNLRARRALFKIGATEEGTLRSHTLMPTGRRRNTIYYSVLRTEWPSLKSSTFEDLVQSGERAA